MVDLERGRPANVLPLPRWTVIIHAVQFVLAIIILGLDAYGIRWIAYNALIFSLVAALLTLGICIYIVATSLFLHKLYNAYLVLGLHILMVIFWIVDLGLVANLARIWASPYCAYYYGYGGYECFYGYDKRDLGGLEHFNRREESTTTGAYYGALAAGAFFGAAQFGLWVLSLVITIIYLNKHRSNPAAAAHAPPSYAGNQHAQVPLEQKYDQHQPEYQQGQPPYSALQTPQPQYAQPAYNQQPQQPYGGTYPQDPVNRQQTVSPASSAGFHNTPQHAAGHGTAQHQDVYNHNVPELSSPQHTGAYNPNSSELSSHK